MGGVYTLGNHEGTVIRGNLFHDVAGLKYGGWGIYFDEGTTHILAENNLVYRTTHGGFHQHYGKENTFRNNIFAFGRDAQIQRTRVENHQSFRFERNIVYWEQGPLFAGDWSKPQVEFDGNTYWRVEAGDIRFGSLTWAEWQKAGMDRALEDRRPAFRQSRRRATSASAPPRRKPSPASSPSISPASARGECMIDTHEESGSRAPRSILADLLHVCRCSDGSAAAGSGRRAGTPSPWDLKALAKPPAVGDPPTSHFRRVQADLLHRARPFRASPRASSPGSGSPT